MNNKNAQRLIIISLSLIVVAMGLLIFLPSPKDEHVSDVAMPEPEETTTAAPAVTPALISPVLPTPSAMPAETPALPSLEQGNEPQKEAEPETEPGALPENEKMLSGVVIGLDPGHQAHSNREMEPVAPGSAEEKKKVSSGTSGVATGIREHEVNLAVGLLLRDMLEEAGATVIMTRETADVDISNVERAKLFNKHEVDLGLRLHCNGTDDESVRGAFMLVPTQNPYKDACIRAAEVILSAYGEATGISIKKGLTHRSDQTGFNWCERPVINIEMGHMSNKEEDKLLTNPDFQIKMAEGLYKGILAYFLSDEG